MVGGNVAISGQVNALGNVVGNYFIGNGSQLTGITQYVLPGDISVDIINGNVIGSFANVTTLIGTTGNVGNVRMVGGNVAISGQVNALGNVVGNYFIGNGSQLTGITSFTLPAVANIDIYGNVTASGNVIVAGFISAIGDISGRYINGNGALLTGVSSSLTGTANVNVNGNVIGSFANVTTLIGTTGNVGNVRMVGGNVAVSGQINTLGNVVAPFFIGNGSQLTGIAQYVLPGSANIDIRGNVTATGNVSAAYFLGNGSQLTGIAQYVLPGSANIDINGNVIGSFANVTTLIGITGNVGNIRMVGGNIATSGQINALGNVVAPFFIGNGSQLTGITATLPGTGSIDITGNVIGVFANVANIIAVQGNVGNVRMLGGNVAISGQVNALGNVVAPYFIGNGALLTGLTNTANARYLSAGRTTNQTIASGSWANLFPVMNTVFANNGITYSAGTGIFTLDAGVSYRITAQLNFDAAASYDFYYTIVYSGNNNQVFTGSAATAMSASTTRGNDTTAPILDCIVTPSASTGYRLRMGGNVTAATGEFIRPDAGTFLTVVGLGGGFDTNLPDTGNIDIVGNVVGSLRGNVIGTYANVTQVIATFANISTTVNANVLVVNSTAVTNTNDMIRISSSSSGTTFNMISAKNSTGNVFRVNGSGAVFGVGAYNTSGADYAEMFEWEDGNTNDEDRRGTTVVKGNNGVIRVATAVDDPSMVFGVVSTNPSIVGDSRWNEWSGRYLRDRFGAKLSNTVYYIANVSNENDRVRCDINDELPMGYEKIASSEFIENPTYDPNVAYVAREYRKEWATIGLVGKLMVLPDQVVNPNWILFKNISHPDGDILEYLVK
jgi:hypothetical protein